MANEQMIQGNLKVENRTDRDLTVAFELRGAEVVLIIQDRDRMSAAGLIIPRDAAPRRLS